MKLYGRMLKKAGFTILQVCVQKFEPDGFTAVWILAESHLALHTFPEENKTYVELSSCNEEMLENFKKEVKNGEHDTIRSDAQRLTDYLSVL